MSDQVRMNVARSVTLTPAEFEQLPILNDRIPKRLWVGRKWRVDMNSVAGRWCDGCKRKGRCEVHLPAQWHLYHVTNIMGSKVVVRTSEILVVEPISCWQAWVAAAESIVAAVGRWRL